MAELTKDTLNIIEGKLLNFQSDQEDFVYAYEDKAENLFWAGDFTGLTNAPYKIISLNWGGTELVWRNVPGTRKVAIDGLNNSNELTIRWRDDVFRSVQRFHTRWIHDNWYNPNDDALVSGNPGAKKKELLVVQFHYVNGVPKVTNGFHFTGIMPIGNGQHNFDYASSNSEIEIKYKFERCSTLYIEPTDENTYDLKGGESASSGDGTASERAFITDVGQRGPNGGWNERMRIY